MSSSVNVKSLYKQRVKNLTGLIFDLFVSFYLTNVPVTQAT